MALTSHDPLAAKVIDLSPLKGMALKELRRDFQRERDNALLRTLTILEAAGEMVPPGNLLTGQTVPERSVCTPGSLSFPYSADPGSR